QAAADGLARAGRLERGSGGSGSPPAAARTIVGRGLMRRIVVPALVAVGLLVGAVPAAQAQTPGLDPCGIPARAPARADLAPSTMFTPGGYGPHGWAPLRAPWGPGP